MTEVHFYDNVEDTLLKFAVIVSRYNGHWVLCKHKKRNTYEAPGGHREKGESIENAARRELWEETGAKSFQLIPICVYSICKKIRKLTIEKKALECCILLKSILFLNYLPLK